MDYSAGAQTPPAQPIYPIFAHFARVNIIFSLLAEFAFAFLCKMHKETPKIMTIR